MVLKQQIFIQKTSLAALLNAFKDGANFTAVGRLFQSFGAEKVKEPDPRSSMVTSVFDFRLSGVHMV